MLSILQQLQPIADKAAVEGRSKPVTSGSRVLRKDIDARVLSIVNREPGLNSLEIKCRLPEHSLTTVRESLSMLKKAGKIIGTRAHYHEKERCWPPGKAPDHVDPVGRSKVMKAVLAHLAKHAPATMGEIAIATGYRYSSVQKAVKLELERSRSCIEQVGAKKTSHIYSGVFALTTK